MLFILARNINDALSAAMEDIQNYYQELPGDRSSPAIYLMVSGEASAGETEPSRILWNVRTQNMVGTAIHSLGLGDAAMMPFLQMLSLQNSASARRIYSDADAAMQIQVLSSIDCSFGSL